MISLAILLCLVAEVTFKVSIQLTKLLPNSNFFNAEMTKV